MVVSMENEIKEYLGDSVYAEFDGFGIVLTTNNGYGPSNTIVLEPEVLAALDRFRARIQAEVAEAKAAAAAAADTQPESPKDESGT